MGFDIRLYYSIRYSRLLVSSEILYIKNEIKTHPLCNPIHNFPEHRDNAFRIGFKKGDIKYIIIFSLY